MNRRSGRSWILVGLGAWLALCAPACAAVFDYPSALNESTPELCQNGLDDDFDGVADCADDSCDGSCTETETRCADGRDNDGDSTYAVPLVDAADPECWRAPQVRERCAFVAGSRLELERRSEAEAFPGPDWVTSGDIVPFRSWSTIDDRLRLLPGEYLESRLALRGTIAPMGVDMHVEVNVGAVLRLSLISERLGEVVAATVTMPERLYPEMWLEGPDGARTPVLTSTYPDNSVEFWEYQLVSINGSWELRTRYGEKTERLPFATALPYDEPLFVRIESRGPGTKFVRVWSVSAAREPFDTCGRSFASPLTNAAALRAAAEGEQTRCLVLAEQAYRSTDGSRWTGSRSPVHAGAIGLAWVPTFSRFEGVRQDPASGDLHFFASDDCDRFRESDALSLASLVALGSPIVVGFDFVLGAAGGERRLWLLGDAPDSADGQVLVELASETGLPNSYSAMTQWHWQGSLWPGHAPLSARRLGDQVVVLGPGAIPNTIAAYVLSSRGAEGELVRTIDPLIEPSGTTGTFDRFRVSHGALVRQPRAAPSEGAPPDDGALPLRVYFFGELLPGEPGYASAAIRSGAGWVDLLFGGPEQ